MNNTVFQPLTLVKAGAGSGKTHYIQETLSTWVTQGKIQPHRILAVTFTNSAAAEMRERIYQNLAKTSLPVEKLHALDDAMITTIHGFGLFLLERFAFERKASPTPRQLNESEQTQLLKQVFSSLSNIDPILQRLAHYGYTGGFQGEYVTPLDQFRQALLSVINTLRTLDDLPTKVNPVHQASSLLTQAKDHLTQLYGATPFTAKLLNQQLWSAIETVQKKHLKDALMDKTRWGSNSDSRDFVTAVFEATETAIASDWSLWKRLQTIKAPTMEKDVDYADAQAIMSAADRLCDHPTPLEEALEHLTILITSAEQALSAYQQGKTQAGLVDFSDMVQLANELLSDQAIFAEVRSLFDCLVIDEFQDTNPLQFALLRRFQQTGLPTLIVGDEKQSIMGFQGADSRLFESLLTKAQAHEIHTMTDNYRSTADVMKFVNTMGALLYPATYQPLTAQVSYQSELTPVVRLKFDCNNWLEQKAGNSKKPALESEEGYAHIVAHLKQQIDSQPMVMDRHTKQPRPLKAGDIAILAPKHKHLQAFAKALRHAGIKAQLQEAGLLESSGVQCVLSALQYFTDPTDHYSALELVTHPLIGADLQTTLSNYLAHKSIQHPCITDIDALRNQPIHQQLRHRGIVEQMILLMETLDLESKLYALTDGQKQLANLRKLMSLAETFSQVQDETLLAMGIYGRQAPSFLAWLSAQEDNDQPLADSNAEDAVVLKTWHGSKGLEWSVVVVLGAHKPKEARLPHIAVNYPAGVQNVDDMLAQAYISYLPEFASGCVNDKLEDSQKAELDKTQRNLVYVALTRAREQIIIPWFEGKDGLKDHSMLSYIAPLFEDAKFTYQDVSVEYQADLLESQKKTATTNTNCCSLTLDKNAMPELLDAMVSPSVHEGHEQNMITVCAESFDYASACDLGDLDKRYSASEIGTWVHRLYQVLLLKPDHLALAMQMPPVRIDDDVLSSVLQAQLVAFKQYLESHYQPIKYECECSVLSMNEQQQIVSGTVDLLLETVDGFWIVDHKTDKVQDDQKHYAQLLAYAKALRLEKPLLGMMINWMRLGKATIYPITSK